MNTFFAAVILIGIAIAITIAAVTWITTTYHSAMWRPEVLKIVDVDIYRNITDDSWWLYIEAVNNGEGVAEVYKIEVYGIEEKEIRPPRTIEPGRTDQVHVKLDKEYTYGTTYMIRLYLKSGTLYPVLERIVRV